MSIMSAFPQNGRLIPDSQFFFTVVVVPRVWCQASNQPAGDAPGDGSKQISLKSLMCSESRPPPT